MARQNQRHFNKTFNILDFAVILYMESGTSRHGSHRDSQPEDVIDIVAIKPIGSTGDHL